MSRQTQIIIAISALALVVLLFLVLKVNRTPVQDKIAETVVVIPDSTSNEGVDPIISGKFTINQLKDSLRLVEDQEKKANFAHHLSVYYKNTGKLDSAAYYEGVAADGFPNEENFLKAGEEYFNAFSLATDAEQADEYRLKSEDYLVKAIAMAPKDPKPKTLLGVLKLASNQGVAGSMLLHEVLIDNPDYAEALYNLGVYAMQSRDFSQAAENFERIIAKDSTQVRANFYLAICYQELGRKDESIKLFNRVKELDSSPEVQANVDAYLDDIK